MHIDLSASRSTASGNRALLATYTATIFLSAFLLFSVQPMFAKLVLPKLGGSPGVWSVAMVFFQSMLLLGYGYAHFLTSRLPFRAAAIVHIAVLVLAFIALPLSIPEGWGAAPTESGQSLWLLGLFAAGIGLPFFAVSANGPLLQAWFAKSGHPDAADPYFLYGASNIGSFASLLLYIAFFEPQFGLSTQTLLWSGGFLLLTALIGGCAILVMGRTPAAEAVAAPAAALGKPTWQKRLLWVALAFIPSGLLVAVTAYISTDIAAAPFLWVIPLALFLLTFVLAFQRKQWFPEQMLSEALPFVALAIFIELALTLVLNPALMIAFHLSFFFVAALYCHTRMADNRPEAAHLTEFYLLMSLGGVLGGIFASLISIHLFDTIFEYPILVVAALLARAAIYRQGTSKAVRYGAIAAAVGIAIYLGVTSGIVPFPKTTEGIAGLKLVLLALGIATALSRKSEARGVAYAVLFLPLALLLADLKHDLYLDRTFFGSLSARTSGAGTHTIMHHGTTQHGAQLISELEGDAKPTPLTYYHESGAIAASLRAAQERTAGRHRSIGAVGLGTGSMFCHRKPNSTWTMFEIDRSVVELASDPKIFSFVSKCGPDAEMVVGDARITLGEPGRGPYDYLLIDAFSSDAIPAHLLTREAFQLYFSRLTETGILAIHISNRSMDLRGIIARIAREEGLVARTSYFGGMPDTDAEYVYPNRVVVLAREEAHFGPVINDDERWYPPKENGADLWTDDYSNVFKLLLQPAPEREIDLREGQTMPAAGDS